MTELWKRTLFGALFVACVVCSILFPKYAFGLLFMVLAVWAVDEYIRLVGAPLRLRWWSIAAAVVAWAGVQLIHLQGIYATCGSSLLVVYPLVVMAALTDELWRKADNPVANWGHLLCAQMMVLVPFLTMDILLQMDKWLLLALFVIIWVNDTGAYCVGSLTAKLPKGNHKMFVRVSPKKSWEGLVGGIVFAIAAALLLNHFGWFDSIQHSAFIACGFAVIACAAGTLGDLMESLLKRTVGVKDSGRFLPGHGGVLDRFDSMLLATPAVLIYCLVCYASVSLV